MLPRHEAFTEIKNYEISWFVQPHKSGTEIQIIGELFKSPSIDLTMIMETAGPGNVALMLPESILLFLCAVNIKGGGGESSQEHRWLEKAMG